MRFVDFKNQILEELCRNPDGLTWKELRDRLGLPYENPCQNWVERMETDEGLHRVKGEGRALIWMVDSG